VLVHSADFKSVGSQRKLAAVGSIPSRLRQFCNFGVFNTLDALRPFERQKQITITRIKLNSMNIPIALRDGGVELAEKYRVTLDQYPVKIMNADLTVTLQAALYKGSYKISYADAYAAALSKLNGATLIAGDRGFSTLRKEIRIHWLTE